MASTSIYDDLMEKLPDAMNALINARWKKIRTEVTSHSATLEPYAGINIPGFHNGIMGAFKNINPGEWYDIHYKYA